MEYSVQELHSRVSINTKTHKIESPREERFNRTAGKQSPTNEEGYNTNVSMAPTVMTQQNVNSPRIQ